MTRTIIALSLLLAPSLCFAKTVTVTFPKLPGTPVMVKPGDRFRLNMPTNQLHRLEPAGVAHNGPAVYSVELKYKVDGGAVKSIAVAQPRSLGMGGYNGTTAKKSVSFKVPSGAKSIEYWLMGSNKMSPAWPDQSASKKQYWSDYGKNFKINVAR